MVDRILQRFSDAANEAMGTTRRINGPPYEQWARTYLAGIFNAEWSDMHRDFAKEFDHLATHRGCRDCDVAPRAGGKSKHKCVGYPLYCIVHNIEAFIILAGSTSGLPEQHLDLIKTQLETNLLLRRDYPHACGRGRIWNVANIITANGVAVRTVGRGKRIRGASHGHHRPGLICGDDLDDDDSIGSDEAKTKTWKWLVNTLIPLGVEEEVNVMISGTILDPEDLPSKLAQTPGWLCRKYKALIKEPIRQDLWREWAALYREQTILKNEGKLARDADPARQFYLDREEEMKRGSQVLWEAKESLYSLMVYRQRNGEASFLTEKQGDPAGAGMCEWSPQCFDDAVVGFDRWPHCFYRAMACDPSKGANDKSDYAPWMWGGIGPDGLIYVDCDMRRRDAKQICVDGVNLCRAFLPHAIGLENDSYGAIEHLWNGTVAESGVECPPVMLVPTQGIHKRVRIRRLTPYLTGYKIRFRRGSPGIELLLGQLRKWPHVKYDDGPDALEMLLRLLNALANTAATAGGAAMPVHDAAAGDIIWEPVGV